MSPAKKSAAQGGTNPKKQLAETAGDTEAGFVTRTLYYSQALLRGRDATAPGPTLESSVAKLHAQTRDACEGRVYRRGDDEETVIWLNDVIVSARSVTGLVLMSDRSEHQQQVGLDFSQPRVPISAVPAPDGSGWQRGAIYFYVRDNHVVVLQSQAVRTSTLREYFNTLLHEHSILRDGEVYDFVPPVTTAFVNSLEGVKYVRLTGAAQPKPAKPAKGSGGVAVKLVDKSMMAEISREVAALIKSKLQGRSIDSAFDPNVLKVEVILRAPAGRPVAAAEAMQELIGDLLRLTNGDPHAVSLDVDSTSTQIRRNKIVMKAPSKLQQHPETMMPSLRDVEAAAADWLNTLMRTNQVG